MNASAARIIRICTLAPLLAAVMLVFLYAAQPEIFGSLGGLLRQLLFLSLFPLLAYPVQPMIPSFREKGREGQRHLAMLFAFAGYLLECVLNVLCHATVQLKMIGWVYFLSGVALLLLNRLCRLRASGHAAGAAAACCIPIALGFHWMVIPGGILLVIIGWASLHTGRHTLPQFLGGALLPICITPLLCALLRF